MPVTFPYGGFLDGQPYPVIPLGSTTVSVSTSTQLTTALSNASAGQRIVLANGTYSGAFTVTSKAGTSSAGISIEAATTGGAAFSSGATFVINNSSYVTLKGLVFPYELGSGNVVAFRGTSSRCRATRCTFGPSLIGSPGTTKATFVFGSDSVDYIRIDHNEFRNKANPGNAILFDGNFTSLQACRHILIDHNVIQSIKPEVDNEKEPIRLGVSSMSKTMSYSVIERNYFFDCICEPEIVSAKAGGIRISGNTFRNCIGGPVYRHGVDGVMSDNYVVDDETAGGGVPTGGIDSTGVTTVVVLTQAQYDALSTKDPHTLYATTAGGGAAGSLKQVTSSSITKVVVLTSSQYAALATKNEATLYVVVGQVPSTVTNAAVTSTTVDSVVRLTQAQYTALGTVDSRTLYLITG